MELIIPRVADFSVTGDGSNANWGIVDWQPLTRVGIGTSTYATNTKVLYSETGMYFLVECEDQRLTCSLTADNIDLFTEDVVEIFLWTDEAHPVYFEYEISPLGYELPILISNNDGIPHGWLPWHYEGLRQTQKATSVRGGEKRSMADVEGWMSEFYIPFSLLAGLSNCQPHPGMTWRGNICRMDYDTNPRSHWTWCTDTGAEFHNFHGFGTFRFD